MPIPLPPAPNVEANLLPAAPNDPPTLGDVKRAMDYRSRVKQNHSESLYLSWFCFCHSDIEASAVAQHATPDDMARAEVYATNVMVAHGAEGEPIPQYNITQYSH